MSMRRSTKIIILLIATGWVVVAVVSWRARRIDATFVSLPQSNTNGDVIANIDEIISLKTTVPLTVGSQDILVVLADTDELREKGLSGVQELSSKQGVLFVFDQPARHSFWMPEMNFPIDMIWIDADKKIIDVTKNAQPLKKGEKPIYYEPRGPAQFVLEVSSGFFDTNDLRIGGEVRW